MWLANIVGETYGLWQVQKFKFSFLYSHSHCTRTHHSESLLLPVLSWGIYNNPGYFNWMREWSDKRFLGECFLNCCKYSLKQPLSCQERQCLAGQPHQMSPKYARFWYEAKLFIPQNKLSSKTRSLLRWIISCVGRCRTLPVSFITGLCLLKIVSHVSILSYKMHCFLLSAFPLHWSQVSSSELPVQQGTLQHRKWLTDS